MMAQNQTFFIEANKKSEVNELKKMLQSPDVLRNSSELKSVIQKVIGCMTLGMDLSSLFTDMIKVYVVWMKWNSANRSIYISLLKYLDD